MDLTERLTLPAADLIPGDVVLPEGHVVDWYPRAGVMGRTALPLLLQGSDVRLTRYVDPEEPHRVVRWS